MPGRTLSAQSAIGTADTAHPHLPTSNTAKNFTTLGTINLEHMNCQNLFEVWTFEGKSAY